MWFFCFVVHMHIFQHSISKLLKLRLMLLELDAGSCFKQVLRWDLLSRKLGEGNVRLIQKRRRKPRLKRRLELRLSLKGKLGLRRKLVLRRKPRLSPRGKQRQHRKLHLQKEKQRLHRSEFWLRSSEGWIPRKVVPTMLLVRQLGMQDVMMKRRSVEEEKLLDLWRKKHACLYFMPLFCSKSILWIIDIP